MINWIKKLFKDQRIRFLFVGGLNTIFGYGIYALLVYIGLNIYIANVISTVLGIFHSYLWNRFYTFRSKDKALGEIVRFITVYLISFAISNVILFVFVTKLGINKYLGGLFNLICTTLISWFGHKYFSFKGDKNDSKN